MLDILKILFCIPFLIYACYSDIKTRRVSNNVWLIMLIGNVFFIIYDVSKYGLPYLYDFSKYNLPYLPGLIISFGLIFLFLQFYERISNLIHFRMMGGADEKLLLVLSIIFPIYPTFQVFGNIFPLTLSLNFFAFSVLGDAVVVAMIIPIGFAVYNLTKMNLDNPLYIFLGYKTKISELNNKLVWIIQDFEKMNGKIKSHYIRSGIEINGEYLFDWNKIPGIDNERFIEFLKDNLGIDWAKSAIIKKIDERTIKVSNEKKSLSLKLNSEKTKVNLKIDDNKTYEFYIKAENDELGVYNEYILPKLKNFLEKGLIKDEIWVTPKLPFMIPLTFGFLIGVFYGDLIFEITKNLLLHK